MPNKIRLTIMDDHQSIVDGYLYRLSNFPEIEVVATLAYGDELEPALKEQPVNVLLLDVQVPISSNNSNPYPILHTIPKLLEQYPDLAILVISMHDERSLIRAIVEAGASGYILKNDTQRIQELGKQLFLLVKEGSVSAKKH
jgi:two-component system nitrate/nitrite response regulator NarL